MELLNSLLAAADGRLLVVLTGREGYWLRADWPVMVFDLAPLTGEQSDALIAALEPSVSTRSGSRCATAVTGCRSTSSTSSVKLVAGAESRVPEVLYEPLFAGLHHPHTDVVPVVEAAAVIGRAGDLPLLRAVVGGDAEDVDGVVAELVRVCVLERRGTDGWRFRHELFREVAAELAPPSRRRDLHSRAGRALVDAATSSNRTGVWSQATSSGHGTTTKPSRLTKRPRSTPDAAAQCTKRSPA